jgi:DNA-binding NtrC family response regulator
LLILDIHFGIGETGLDILPYIKQICSDYTNYTFNRHGTRYGQSVTNLAGDMIFDFISKPVTETELIIKIKKALLSIDSLGIK